MGTVGNRPATARPRAAGRLRCGAAPRGYAGMSKKAESDVARFYDSAAADYHRMYQRENLANLDYYPANYFRLQILVRRLAALGAKRVYEVGVGEGTPLVSMAKLGMDVAGCDI